jgi:hypothetical protein
MSDELIQEGMSCELDEWFEQVERGCSFIG